MLHTAWRKAPRRGSGVARGGGGAGMHRLHERLRLCATDTGSCSQCLAPLIARRPAAAPAPRRAVALRALHNRRLSLKPFQTA